MKRRQDRRTILESTAPKLVESLSSETTRLEQGRDIQQQRLRTHGQVLDAPHVRQEQLHRDAAAVLAGNLVTDNESDLSSGRLRTAEQQINASVGALRTASERMGGAADVACARNTLATP